MQEQGLLYLVPTVALVGLVLKFCILFNISIKNKIAEAFAIACLFFLLNNLAEFLGYFSFLQTGSVNMIFLHLYMATLYFIFPAVLLLAMSLVEWRFLRPTRFVLFGMSAVLTIAEASGYIVTGAKFIGWTANTTPGEYYWYAIGFVILNALATLIVLVSNYLCNPDFEIRSRCKANLLAFAPMLTVVFTVPVLRSLGYDSSSATTLPAATIFFLCVMLLQTNGNIFWASLRLKILLSVITMKNIQTLNEILVNIEKIRIVEALKAANGKQNNAAELLNIPASTLNRKITKYGIDAAAYRADRLLQLGS